MVTALVAIRLLAVHKITDEIQIYYTRLPYLIREQNIVRFDIKVNDIKLVYMLQSYANKYK